MNNPFSILSILLILASCSRNQATFDKDGTIGILGTPAKVEYFKNMPGSAFRYSDTASFSITDSQELRTVITEIKNAGNPKPCKGAGWNRIKVSYADTALFLFTDNEIIGLSASGKFYQLNRDNFITKRIIHKQ